MMPAGDCKQLNPTGVCNWLCGGGTGGKGRGEEGRDQAVAVQKASSLAPKSP
jgi:hypothetical protein